MWLYEWQVKILEKLMLDSKVLMVEFVEIFGIFCEIVWCDLMEMEQSGYLWCVYGGVVFVIIGIDFELFFLLWLE